MIINLTDRFVAFRRQKSKSKKRWFGKVKHSEPLPTESAASDGPLPPQPPPRIPAEEIKEVRLTSAENEQNKHVYSVALASAVAAEAAAVAAQAAAEVVRLTATTRVSAKSREEVAAIKIQTAFRGYMVLQLMLFNPLLLSLTFAT